MLFHRRSENTGRSFLRSSFSTRYSLIEGLGVNGILLLLARKCAILAYTYHRS